MIRQSHFRSLTQPCTGLLKCIPLLCGVFLTDWATAQEDGTPAADGPWISSVAWHGDQEILGTNSQGLLLRPARLVKANVSDLNALETVGESETSLWSVLPLADGRIVASDYKGGVHVFGPGEPKAFAAETRWIRALSLTPDEGIILAGTEDGKLVELSVADLNEKRRVEVQEPAIFDIAFSPTKDKLATAGGDGTIKVFSWPELALLGQMSRGEEAIWSLVFSEDGSRIVSGGADRRIQLWDVDSAESICTITRTPDWITSIIAMPQSSVVVASCMDGSLVVADHQALAKVTTFQAAESGIWSAKLNADASKIAIGTRKHGLGVVEVGNWIDEAKAVAEQVAKIRPPAPKK